MGQVFQKVLDGNWDCAVSFQQNLIFLFAELETTLVFDCITKIGIWLRTSSVWKVPTTVISCHLYAYVCMCVCVCVGVCSSSSLAYVSLSSMDDSTHTHT